MKKIIYSILSFSLIMLVACEQVPIEVTPPEAVTPAPACPEGASAGTASFTKFIAIGNSFVAGVQGGALFTTGQNNSLPAILNKQFECVGAPSTFNQPTIGASLGWNLFITQPFLSDNTKPILGRMLLQYNGATTPRPTPQAYAPGNLEALPNPAANPGFIYGNGTTKAALNNFGIPAILLGQALIPQTGNWALAGTDPRFSPFYGRLAYPGNGTSTLINDAAAAGGSFFMLWLGLDDFFLHAAFGGDPAKAPLTNAVGGTPTDFDYQYTAAITILLGSNPNLKGVVANFPDIFKMPHFTSVPYNAIVFTSAEQASKIDPTNAAYASYNAALSNPAFMLTPDEIAKRTISFAVGANGIVIEDETLTNLTAYGVPSIRQAKVGDIIPFAAATILGTEATPGNPATTWGVGKALTDQYALIPSEITAINNARTAYNAIIASVVNANSTKLALADVNTALNTLLTSQAAVYNGVTITPNINPPTGIYSEDGAHFNTRGYAFISRVVIGAINTKFTATIPLTNLANYSATALPIP